MPYTYRSLVVAWLTIFALFAVSASGVAHGPWFALLVAFAMAVPMLVLRDTVGVAAAPVAADARVAAADLRTRGLDSRKLTK